MSHRRMDLTGIDVIEGNENVAELRTSRDELPRGCMRCPPWLRARAHGGHAVTPCIIRTRTQSDRRSLETVRRSSRLARLAPCGAHGVHANGACLASHENYDWHQAGGGIVVFAKFFEEVANH